MPKRRQFAVYLSSTLSDLVEERKAAVDLIGHHGVVVDSYRAGSEPVAATCVADVRECDLYVGILGKRYGYRPPGADNPDGKSITELEYEACTSDKDRRIPRLIFLKTRFDDELTDPDPALINAFRDRVRREQTVAQFKDIGELKLALERAMNEASRTFHAEFGAKPGGAMGGGRPRADLLRAIALAKLTGTDDGVLTRVTDARFHVFDCSPDDPQWLASLDAGLRRGQAGCLLVTPAGFSRLRESPAAERVAAAIESGNAAARPLTLVLAGVDPTALPASWLGAPHFETGADAFGSESAPYDALYQSVRTRNASVSPLERLALPYVILVPTRQEMQALLEPQRSGFSGFADEDERSDWIEDFDRVATAARKADNTWPADLYAPERQRWRCFGAGGKDLESLLLESIEHINGAREGTRERRLLREARVVPRAYRVEELLHDRFGSAAALIAAVQSGGLVIVDEFALLEPRLRDAAKRLLASGRTAVVSISACDPAHSPTRRLLSDRSFFRVGALLTRFADEYDPRCELAVNSVARLQRWFRLAIPDLLAAAEGAEPQTHLVDKVWA